MFRKDRDVEERSRILLKNKESKRLKTELLGALTSTNANANANGGQVSSGKSGKEGKKAGKELGGKGGQGKSKTPPSTGKEKEKEKSLVAALGGESWEDAVAEGEGEGEEVKEGGHAQVEAQLNELFPNKCELTAVKLASRTIVYCQNNIAYFFDVHERGDYYPALPLLWKIPSAMKTIQIHSAVSKFLLNGADLMSPGIDLSINDLSKLEINDKVCIRVICNPMPFAIGKSETNYTNIVSSNNKGKAVSIVHIFGDLLWSQFGSVIPNSGFSLNYAVILPIETYEQSIQETTSPADESSNTVQGLDKENENTIVDVANVQLDENNTPRLDEESENPTGNTTSAAETKYDEAPSVAPVNRAEVDIALVVSLLRLVKYILKESELPMLVSTLWNLLLRCNPFSSTPLEVKNSNYRKVSTFMEYAHNLRLITLQSEGDVLRVTSMSKKHDLYCCEPYKTLVKLDNVEEFKKIVLNVTEIDEVEQLASITLNAANMNLESKSSGGVNKYKVYEIIKLTKTFRSAFGDSIQNAGPFEFTDNPTSSEFTSIVQSIIKQLNLEDSQDKALVLINPESQHESERALFKMINKLVTKSDQQQEKQGIVESIPVIEDQPEEEDYNSSQDSAYHMVGGVLTKRDDDFPSLSSAARRPLKPVYIGSALASTSKKPMQSKPAAAPLLKLESPIRMSRSELLQKLKHTLTKVYVIITPFGSIVDCGSTMPVINIEVERRAGNKVVTKVRGLDIYKIDVSVVAKAFQKKFASSAAVDEAQSGKQKTLEITIQGNWLFQVEEYVQSDCKIPKNYIISKMPNKKK